MIVGAVCMSHSPLMDRNRASSDTEARFHEAIEGVAGYAAKAEADLAIVFYPDHINGFFYDLLPAFCVGIEGSSVGDFGTAAGKLDIPEALAMDLARSVIAQGVDTAISYRMEVDHGAAQPIELLFEQGRQVPVIPIFINCAASPRPTFARARALGAAVGRWAEQFPGRVLIIGSGGLSHDPPVPALATATPEVRTRLIEGGSLSHGQRLARQNRAIREGKNLADGTSSLLPLNPEWDRMLIDAFAGGNLAVLDEVSEDELTATGGRGGHEIRCWVSALAALGAKYDADVRFYEPINEWITGMGIVVAEPA